jgi:hypothetical protein
MVGRVMAQMHIEDMVRAADRERMARRVRRSGARGSVLRRVAGAAVSAVLWPVRN